MTCAFRLVEPVRGSGPKASAWKGLLSAKDSLQPWTASPDPCFGPRHHRVLGFPQALHIQYVGGRYEISLFPEQSEQDPFLTLIGKGGDPQSAADAILALGVPGGGAT